MNVERRVREIKRNKEDEKEMKARRYKHRTKEIGRCMCWRSSLAGSGGVEYSAMADVTADPDLGSLGDRQAERKQSAHTVACRARQHT